MLQVVDEVTQPQDIKSLVLNGPFVFATFRNYAITS